jgi:hypothetical protein
MLTVEKVVVLGIKKKKKRDGGVENEEGKWEGEDARLFVRHCVSTQIMAWSEIKAASPKS